MSGKASERPVKEGLAKPTGCKAAPGFASVPGEHIWDLFEFGDFDNVVILADGAECERWMKLLDLQGREPVRMTRWSNSGYQGQMLPVAPHWLVCDWKTLKHKPTRDQVRRWVGPFTALLMERPYYGGGLTMESVGGWAHLANFAVVTR